MLKGTELSLKIKTYDIDIAGHVNNIVYVKWFEDLRTKLFDENFNMKDLLLKHLYPVVVSTKIKYKKYLTLFDEPVGFMGIDYYNHGVLTLRGEIKAKGKVVVLGEQKCVLLNLCKSKIVNGTEIDKLLYGKEKDFE